MKKCASCTKDLPDAALHCVFCGAKQAPAPAVPGSAAKTVMGHASNEMIEALKAQAAAAQRQQAPAPAPYTPPAPAPYTPPAPAPYTPPAPAPYTPPAPAPYTPAGFTPTPGPAPAARPAPVPTAGSVAPTMFVPGGGPPSAGPSPAPHPGNLPTMMAPSPMAAPAPMPSPAPLAPPAPMPMPMPMPMSAPAPAPIPSAAPPYLASRTAARAGRPIEPWKDSLRLMMFIWGGALIAAFMVPVATKPDLAFWFQVIIDGEGTQKLPPLLMAAVGLLSIVLAAIPTSPSPRGLIAALLGLSGILIPELLMLSKGDFGFGQIMQLISLLGYLMIVPGLLLRSEYQDSIMPRIMVTLGALCVLASYLIPAGEGGIPIVGLFEMLIDAPGKAKIGAILFLGPAVLALLSLLVWMPAPGSAGSKVFAWLWILWGAILLYTALLVEGNIGRVVELSPYTALVSWVAGGGAELPIHGAAYLALSGWGLATVLGKKLE